jgi:glutathione S-transferase
MSDATAVGADVLRVYHRVKSGRPVRVLWTLEELGRPYTLVTMSASEAAGPDHLARHPLGRVPVIDAGDGPLFESAALCLHLADGDPAAGLIAPLGTHARALVYQWAFFAMAEIEPPIVEAHRVEAQPDLADAARDRTRRAVAVIDAALADAPYLAGDAFTVADIIAGEVTRLAVRTGAVEPSEHLADYLERIKQRPARARALAAAHA